MTRDEIYKLLSQLPSGDTESVGSVLQEFDCESVPIPPGTKGRGPLGRPRKPKFVVPWWGWLTFAAVVVAAWLAGALSGFPLR
jgi:hypothetical protein